MAGCEALVGLALFACLTRDPACLPLEQAHLRDDLRAIVMQESAGRPYAIRDEATGESFFPATHADAVRIATERDARGHVLGLGLGQITGRSNWRRHGLTIADALRGCPGLRAAALHYAGDLDAELARLRGGALARYNSGRPDGAPAYAAAVLGRMRAGASRSAPVAPSAPDDALVPSPCAPSWDAWALVACERRAAPPSVPARGAAGKVASNAPAQGTPQR